MPHSPIAWVRFLREWDWTSRHHAVNSLKRHATTAHFRALLQYIHTTMAPDELLGGGATSIMALPDEVIPLFDKGSPPFINASPDRRLIQTKITNYFHVKKVMKRSTKPKATGFQLKLTDFWLIK